MNDNRTNKNINKDSGTSRKRQMKMPALALVVCASVFLCAGIGYGIYAAGRHLFGGGGQAGSQNAAADASQASDGQNSDSAGFTKKTGDERTGSSSFTFTGVGDNLLHDTIFVYYEQDNGSRDYLPIYENTLPYTQKSDLSYINFETICAGDEFGLSSYPSFNGPLEMIDTLSETGVNWISTASNHSLDRGVDGMLAEMGYLSENYPQITYTGSYLDEQASYKPVVVDLNGIQTGLASFTYGLNGLTLPEGYEWLIDVYADGDGSINYQGIDEVLDALNEVSDVQVVTMHWGEEYQNVPNAVQEELAAYLNKKGVEVIVGAHPHVIQPAEILHGENQDTLVYYSLGNFLSAQNHNNMMVGGMADFTLDYNFDTGQTTFENVKFIPTVTWISPDLRQYRTNILPDYTDEMAQSQYVYAVEGEDISPEWVREYVHSVMGDPEGIEIVYE